MKTVLTVLGLALGLVVVVRAGPEEPEIFPGQEDAMLRKLMGEMLRESEEARREMEKPVELPKIDAPELRRLLGAAEAESVPRKQWKIGIAFLVDEQGRIQVVRAMEGGPAAEAGLRPGDVLTDLNGIRLRDHAMLVDLLQLVRDQEVELGVRRGDQDVRVRITARIHEPVPKGEPGTGNRDDEVLQELRGMRALMEEMLKEIKKQTPKVRSIPTPPKN